MSEIINGVECESRYQDADELETMQKMILALPEDLVDLIQYFWCDSKPSCWYVVVLKKWDEEAARAVANKLGETARQLPPYGYNCIDVHAPDKTYRLGGRPNLIFGASWDYEKSAKMLEADR